MAEEWSALNIVISADDELTGPMAKMQNEIAKQNDALVDDLKKQDERLRDITESMLSNRDVQAQISEDMKTQHGEELARSQERLDFLKTVGQAQRDELAETEKDYIKNKKTIAANTQQLIKLKKMQVEAATKGDKKSRDSLAMTRKALLQVRRALMTIGTQSAASAKKFSASWKGAAKDVSSVKGNFGALSAMNEDGKDLIATFGELGGQDFSATIQGISGVAEQIKMMKDIAKKGGTISKMMKLNLALTAVQALGPAIKATISYFKDLKAVAKEVAGAVEGLKKASQGMMDRDKKRTEANRLAYELAETEEEKAKVRQEEMNRISIRSGNIQAQITDEKNQNSKRWSMFSAEAIKLSNERIKNLEKEYSELQKQGSWMDEALPDEIAYQKAKQKLGHKGEIAAMQEELEIRKASMGLNEREIELMKYKRRASKEEHDPKIIEDMNKQINAKHDQIKAEKDLADAKKKVNDTIAAGVEAAKQFGQTLKENMETQRSAMESREKQLMKQAGQDEILKREQLKAQKLTEKDIDLIIEQDKAMAKLEGKGPDPTSEVAAKQEGRLTSGKTTDQMTESERMTAEYQKRVTELAEEQLAAFREGRITVMEAKLA